MASTTADYVHEENAESIVKQSPNNIKISKFNCKRCC